MGMIKKHVFISYSHKDVDYARKLATELRKHSIEVWMDDRIDFGTQWPRVIQENLEASAAVIVIMSTNAYKSDWVQSEVSFAQAEKKTIFPILLEGKAWVPLAATQYVDARTGDLPPQSYFKRVANHISTMPMIRETVQEVGEDAGSQSSKASSMEADLNSDIPYVAMRARQLQEARIASQNPPTKETLGQDPLVGETVIAASYALRTWWLREDIPGVLILTNKRLVFKAASEDDSLALSRRELTGKRTAEEALDGYELKFATGFAKPTHRFWISEAELYHALDQELKLEWIPGSTNELTPDDLDDIDSRPVTYL